MPRRGMSARAFISQSFHAPSPCAPEQDAEQARLAQEAAERLARDPFERIKAGEQAEHERRF